MMPNQRHHYYLDSQIEKSYHQKPDESTYPPALIDEDRWIIWKPHREKKRPLNPNSGRFISYDDPDYQYSFQQALDYSQENPDWGIGFLIADSAYVLIDGDNVRNRETGEIHPKIESLTSQADSYADISISGSGIHIIIKAEKPDSFQVSLANPEFPDAKLEIWTKKFVAMSGNHIPDSPRTIEARQNFLDGLYDEFDVPIGESDSAGSRQTQPTSDEIESPSKDTVDKARACLREFRLDSKTTDRARGHIENLQSGDYKSAGFKNDRSKAEINLASLLFGIFESYGDASDNSQKLTKQYLIHLARKYPHTNRGKPRKILRVRGYLNDTVRNAVKGFDSEKFRKWQRKKDSWDTWTGDYSDIVYDELLSVIQALSDGFDDYPTRKEIVALCHMKNPDRARETFRKALRRLRDEYGQICMAEFEENPPVYYLASSENPENAVSIKHEKYDKNAWNEVLNDH